jgi:DNA-binding transcriptional ArsR family regulator
MKNKSLDREHLEGVARLFAVLAEPTRLAILQQLKEQPMAVKELVTTLRAKQANVSKQLGILYDAGLVERQREGGFVRYSIREPMIFELCHLVCDKLRRDAERQIASLKRLA